MSFEISIFRKAAKQEWESKSRALHGLRQMSEDKDRWHFLERCAFRWKLNGKVLSNAYDSQEMEDVCEGNNLRIWEKIDDDMAVVERINNSL